MELLSFWTDADLFALKRGINISSCLHSHANIVSCAFLEALLASGVAINGDKVGGQQHTKVYGIKYY